MFWARQPQTGTQTNKHVDAKVVTYHNCSEQHNPGHLGIAVNKVLQHTQKRESDEKTDATRTRIDEFDHITLEMFR